MNYRGIIVAGAIAIGLYLFSKTKKISDIAAVRKAAAQKIGKKIGKKVAQKVNISKLSVQQLRYMIAHAAALKKTGKEVAAWKAEVARREAAWKAAQKVASKRIGQPTTQAARIAAARKAAVRKAAAQKIGKKIGKKVAQKVAQKNVASWKAPYRFPNHKFRVITPSNLLKKLAKKDIARKKAVQQKKVQKTTPSTPSNRRKSRLEALYGSHWHDIWIQRQKRR